MLRLVLLSNIHRRKTYTQNIYPSLLHSFEEYRFEMIIMVNNDTE